MAMAKTLSQNRIRSTEALASRSDLTSLNTLSQTISNNLLTAMTVIDAEDFPKIHNIQNTVRNKNTDIQALMNQQVITYNTHFQTYESANNQLIANGRSPHPTPTSIVGMTPPQQTRYSALFAQAQTANNAMNAIANITTPALLDVSTLPTITSGTLHNLIALQTNLIAKNAPWETITTE